MPERQGGGAVSRGAVFPEERLGAHLLCEAARGGVNTVFSPASIAAALRMALLGAGGGTADAIASVLGCSGAEEATRGLALRSRRLAALSGGPITLRAPAMMWVQARLPLRPAFTQKMNDLGAAARDADFRAQPEHARAEINRVVAQETAGKIEGLLPPGSLSSATRLVLAGAVYLKAPWAFPFAAGRTGEAPFATADGHEVAAAMMRLTASLGYLRADGYQAVLLPYRETALSMAVLLPDGPLAPLEERLGAVGVTGLLAGAAPARMRLGLPRFCQRTRFDLVPVLERLGMGVAFTAGADFSSITDAEPIAISAVGHMGYIDVDEQGTEAAAATAAGFRTLAATAPPPLEVVVDRPFLFAITDTGSGQPLFLGRVADPTAG